MKKDLKPAAKPKPIAKKDPNAKKQLEELFRGVKKAKTSRPVEEEVQPVTKKAEPQLARGSADDLFGTGAARGLQKNAARKTTEEGWPVYSLEEIGLATTGGDTKDCPFDCSCCY